jgi:hypothetical protein
VTIDPRVEEPLRKLLGHAIRGEFGEMITRADSLGEQRFLNCLAFCLRVAGYIVIDVSGYKWPTDTDVREIAQRMAMMDSDYELPEEGAYEFLARAALGFEPLTDVFPDKEKAASVPLLTTASLLVAYRPEGKHWWEYLDVIEGALEEAAPLSEAAFPAALLLSRRSRALKANG